MLILTRRPDESIIIDDDIKIKVLGIRGNQNRISYILQFNVCLLNTESGRSDLTPHITSSEKQSEERATLFAVRVHVIVSSSIFIH